MKSIGCKQVVTFIVKGNNDCVTRARTTETRTGGGGGWGFDQVRSIKQHIPFLYFPEIRIKVYGMENGVVGGGGLEWGKWMVLAAVLYASASASAWA